jgi:hypothetical protein
MHKGDLTITNKTRRRVVKSKEYASTIRGTKQSVL